MMPTDQDLLERVASGLHEGWREYHEARGRVFGAERTPTTHPHLVPWEKLDHSSQNQDRFTASLILDEWARGTLAPNDLPGAIHEAWRRYTLVQGRKHPHAQPFALAHPSGGEDHEAQAASIRLLLDLVRPSGAPSR
jgi:hypothetical protein